MKVLNQSVGVDVSKDSISCCFGYLDGDRIEHYTPSKTFQNSIHGFKKLTKWVEKYTHQGDLIYVMEATGVYYENLAYWLFEREKKVSVILPGRAHHFAKTLEIKTKTDLIDARILSQMGIERSLTLWSVPSPMMHQMKALTREYRENKAKMVVIKNQLHAKQHAHDCAQSSIRRLKKHIRLIERYLHEIESELRVLVMNDSKLGDKIERIMTIPGVGFMTVVCLLGETNGFALVRNGKQLASYAGFDVRHNQSGKKQGKSRISKQGNSFIRSAVYMPALCCIQCNPELKAFFKRTTEGKPSKKIGVTAVARKLLILIYTLWKNDSEYQPKYSESF